MKIACIGWGSLIWQPENLAIQTKWFEDGPLLPIEFTRISDDGRVTLIIDKSANTVRTLWALMNATDMTTAINSLKERENIKNDKGVKSVQSSDKEKDEIKNTVILWLNSKQLDGAIWTGLSFSKKTNNTKPRIEIILTHLRKLGYGAGQAAEEYIRKAPKQIDTEYRRKIVAEFGWTCLNEQ